MPIAIYEFTPDQAKDLDSSNTGSILEVLDGLPASGAINGLTSYMIGGNLYVVVSSA